MTRTAKLSLTVQYQDTSAGLPSRSEIRRWVSRALQQQAVLTVRWVGQREGRMLNRVYRQRDRATNVLSFAYPNTTDKHTLYGDIVLCTPVLIEEAERQGKALKAHCAHMLVHGVLHLQGYDHQDEEQASIMENRETEILDLMGYPDPYQLTQQLTQAA